MRSTRGLLFLFGLLLTPIACVPAPERSDEQDQQDQPAQPVGADQTAAQPTPTPTPTPEAAGPLTPEEERLIAADPSTLSPGEKRMRGYALRKKIMQNPDSEAARSLLEAQAAALAGEIQPGTASPGTAAPEQAGPKRDENGGLVIDLPPHLREQQAGAQPQPQPQPPADPPAEQ